MVKNVELKMSTCKVADQVPIRAPGLRRLQIAVKLKLRLTLTNAKKERISVTVMERMLRLRRNCLHIFIKLQYKFLQYD